MKIIYICSMLSAMAMMVSASTYNAFRQQMGYCKLQGFDTVSRSTSGGMASFLDGRVVMGVGLSDAEFNGSITSCGRCIEITTVDNMAPLAFELDALVDSWTEAVNRPPFLAMVMDQCTDPICVSRFLDFDVYLPTPPVSHGNPGNVEWHFVPCPIVQTREILFCLSAACREDAIEGRIALQVIQESSPYYWAIYPRFPVRSISVLVDYGEIPLRDENGWAYHGDAMDLSSPFVLRVDNEWSIEIHLTDHTTTPGYRGGILIHLMQDEK
jgi:hypothetical protein